MDSFYLVFLFLFNVKYMHETKQIGGLATKYHHPPISQAIPPPHVLNNLKLG